MLVRAGGFSVVLRNAKKTKNLFLVSMMLSLLLLLLLLKGSENVITVHYLQ